MRAAAAERRFERAAWLRRRLRRLGVILGRLDGVLEATHARPRLVLASHPVDPGRRDAFWLAGGRLVDWGAAPGDPEELVRRTTRARARGGRPGELGAHVPPDEVDEVRLVRTYLASHPDLPQLTLEPAPTPGQLQTFVGSQEKGSSRTSARVSSPTVTADPGETSRRTSASAIHPNRGDCATLPSRPTSRSS